MNKPSVTREGDSWVFVWPEHNYRIDIGAIHENGDGMHADLNVQTATLLEGSDRRGHIHWSRVNLGWSQGRSTVIKTIATKTKSSPDLWTDLLEYAIVTARDHHRAGEPLIDLATIAAQLDVPFLVKPLIPVGETTILMADGESGKSWCALAIAVAVRNGLALPGIPAPKSCPVLYLDYETGRPEIRRRLEMFARGLRIETPHIHYLALHRSLADEAPRIRAEIDRLGIGLVILDSIGPATADDLVAGAAAIRAMNALRSLRVSRLVLAHVARSVAQQTNGRGYTYGSVFFENLARSVWELRSDPSGSTGALGLFHRKSNLGPRQDPLGWRLVFDDAAKCVTVQGQAVTEEPQLAQYAPLRLRVMTALRAGAKSIKVLAEQLEIPESTLRSALPKMTGVIQLEEGKSGRGGSSSLWALQSQLAD